MTVTILKERIRKAMDNVDDSVLEEVYAVLKKAQRRHRSLKSMTLEEFFARNAQSQKDIKEGRVYSTKAVLKRFGIKRK